MCGIVGYIGTQAASGILLEGLRKLEYRGYDSAGIATISEGKLHRVRAKGKLYNLQDKLSGHEMPGLVGIGHTRWATHGKPEEHNAHPHFDTSHRVAVVQNGIVENYRELRDELKQRGYEFFTETDTEVIPNLVAECLAQMKQDGEADRYYSLLTEAVRRVVQRLEGAFAIVVLAVDAPDEIVVARQQAPLVLGFGQGEFFCASDVPAILPHTHAILPLENGEMATLTPLGIEVYNFAGDRLKKHPHILSGISMTAEKQGFRHYMLKEIYEQPSVVRTCLETYINSEWTPEFGTSPVSLGLPPETLTNLDQIHIVSCGTSWHASLVGKYLIEQIAQVPCHVHYASEFRYAPPPLTANTLIIGVTQSGETADTLSAIHMEKERRTNQPDAFRPRLLGITNRAQSSLTRLVDSIIDTHAGIEVGVAATKTFTGQLMAFYCLALDLAHSRKAIALDRLEGLVKDLRKLPAQMEQMLEHQEQQIEALAHEFAETQDFIFIGRGINFPIALEGALKLKEISYIHAEGYPAGEMKHGPIALLDEKVPVVAIAMPGAVYEKVISNAQEAKARDARLIGVTPAGNSAAAEVFNDLLAVPQVDELLSPILTVIPLQFLAYHIAARRGLDVDQPRNLAKSVTVE
jgi:glucosamine--fructose-6-phosphate aminotransferase (isomerizing)